MQTKTLNIFELTCPAETRIDVSNTLKAEKYQHLETDIQKYKTTVTPFEVGSHTGFINQRNKANIHLLHKFVKKNIKLKQFMKNISAICVLSSFYIFNYKDIENWDTPDPIRAPFPSE